jgi:Na+-driven multidrug efflux pump
MNLSGWQFMIFLGLNAAIRYQKLTFFKIQSSQFSCSKFSQILYMNATFLIDSVRISNELGAGRPKAAQFSILVVLMSSVTFGIFFSVLILDLRNVFAVPFTNNPEVADAVSSLAIVFSLSLFLNCIQPVLSGTPNFFFLENKVTRENNTLFFFKIWWQFSSLASIWSSFIWFFYFVIKIPVCFANWLITLL